MVFDCFPFLNELDLLEIRLNELNSVVDRFVICESAYTHAFNYKGFVLEENKERFASFWDKITYLKINRFQNNSSWFAEPEQRTKAVFNSGAQIEDIVILSDLDEIPRVESLKLAIQNLVDTNNPQLLMLKLFFYGVNCEADKEWEEWPGCSVAFRNHIGNVQKFRESRLDYNILKNAGWHYSYLGDEEHIKYKMKNFSHYAEMPSENFNKISEIIKDKTSVIGCTRTFNILPIEGLDAPNYILSNPEKFKHLIING